MPWFHHKSDEEKQQEAEQKSFAAEEARVQEASLASIRAGGLPVRAQQRLDEVRKLNGKFFTSDLGVNEFLLARQVGVRAISQVMGSSVYHVGWQMMPGQYGSGWPFAMSRELEVVSQALNHCRTLALGRLAEEAERAGAHAVIGVRVSMGTYDWGSDLMEFQAFGTAVSVDGGPPVEGVALTNLSGQDFWKLYQAGYWPVGVVGGSTVYYVVASWATQMANNSFWGSWSNMELQDFTQGLYTARHLAMSRLWSEARHLGGAGVVGTQLEQSEREHEVDLGNDQERTDMIFTFHAMGTAIAELAHVDGGAAASAVVNLRT